MRRGGLREGLGEQGIPGVIGESLEQPGGADRPLLYGGGPVQHEQHIHVIFWGSNWNEATGSAVRTQLLKMYEGLPGSAFQSILVQYFDQTGHIESNVSVSSYTDTKVKAPSNVNWTKVTEEIASAIAANKWTGELDAQFVLVSAPGSTYEKGFFGLWCGVHGDTPEGEWPYTFYPYMGEEPFAACRYIDSTGNIGNAMSAVASHEYAESATDPRGHGWVTELNGTTGPEIADICLSKTYEITEGPLNGSWVEPLWDNREHGCSLSDLEPFVPEVQAATVAEAGFSPHEIRLTGWVDPEGLESKYHFEYGTTTSYGTTLPVPDASAGSGFAEVRASQVLKGVEEGIYHYRLVATNSTGTAYGEDRTVVSPGYYTKSLPLPPGITEGWGEGVSCVAPQACVQVGQYWNPTVKTYETMASSWEGGEWTRLSPINPSGLENHWANLAAVSCTAASSCTAVGTQQLVEPGSKAPEGGALAERWNGSAWSIQTTPSPSGATQGGLSGVSCVSSTECEAVGWYMSKAGVELTLAEHWNGSAWSIQTTPNPSGGSGNRLSGVSCTSASFCVAVGHFVNSAYEEFTLTEQWNGSAWSIATTPGTSGQASLSGVSCTAASACTAVGYQGLVPNEESTTQQPLAERWNGSAWTTQSTVGGIVGATLSGVSCVSSTACTAVGAYMNPSADIAELEALGERWDGTKWTLAAMPGKPGLQSPLYAVSCVEATACFAVGGDIDAFAEHEFSPPSIVTEAASSSPGSATASGVLNPHALESTYSVEYGATTSYGQSSAAGKTALYAHVASTFGNLEQGTTYHYRFVASNADGTTYGEDHTVTTRKWAAPAALPGVSSSTAAVSCASSTLCVAVGGSRTGSVVNKGEVALAREWNGSGWAVHEAPLPSGATGGVLAGVSCASGEACAAVGHYISGSGVETVLPEAWSKAAGFSTQTAPAPAEATASRLSGVSCASVSACTAVGSYLKAGARLTLAERWNGTEWVVQSTPNPSGMVGEAELAGVSCASSSECVAVGHYRFFEGSFEHWAPLAERWNGVEWSIVATPSPSEGRFNALLGVSCVSSSACAATGWTQSGAGARTALAERWNGTTWSLQSAPNPSGGALVTLAGVACNSATACEAVGHYRNGSNLEVTLAERWNGTEWALQTTPSEATSELLGVSCASGEACVSVGVYLVGGKLETAAGERYAGGEWLASAVPGAGSAASSVACGSATSCVAVGRADSGSLGGASEIALAREWNGSEWLTQEPALPAGARASALSGIACASSEWCVAVGRYANGSGAEVTLATRWSRTGKEKGLWTAQSAPNPAEATASRLSAVSCTSSSACTAVGSYVKPSVGRVTLAERWNGTEWVVQSTPNPTGTVGEAELSGVSCASASECVAVGHYHTLEEKILERWYPLAERWNGTEWTIMTTPHPIGAKFSTLLGVSCSASSACAAVGAWEKTTGAKAPLVEGWNGSAWSQPTVPSVGSSTNNVLSSVSCGPSASCVAVGHYVTSAGVETPVAEAGAGSVWVLLSAPSEGTGSELAGTACPSPEACLAVGRYLTSEKLEMSFADRYF